jgi:uncharacterized protein (DUF934 family)
MRQIIRRREIVADDWRYAGEPGDGPQVQPLVDVRAAVAADAAPAAGLGVALQPTDEVDQLADLLPRLALIVIDFPKAGEGRGFSQARMLRQRLGFRGELRARGALKRDQLFLLARCGFDAYDLDPAENLQESLAAFGDYSVGYQRPPQNFGLRVRQRA